jgi:chemotaxis protein CheZ
MNHEAISTGDLEDLDALFDSIVMESRGRKPVAKASPSSNSSDLLINRIGRLTRVLHDSLQELGYNKNQQRSTPIIPNAFDRLHYVALMATQAADNVLSAAEAAQPVVEQVEIESQRLAREWQKLFDNKLEPDQFRHLASQTRDFLAELPRQAKATNSYLTEIMMAQAFQEMAGQVIQQVVDVTQQLEKQLLEILIANPPSTDDPNSYVEVLSRPANDPGRPTDAASNQDQINDLLESFDF